MCTCTGVVECKVFYVHVHVVHSTAKYDWYCFERVTACGCTSTCVHVHLGACTVTHVQTCMVHIHVYNTGMVDV